MEFVEPIRDLKQIDDMKKLMIADENYRDHLLFTLGINSGLRVSDLLSIKWELFLNEKRNLLKGGSAIIVTEKKTGKAKRFKLNKSIRKAVESFHETFES
ncbi:MAG TPA: site-specific integrase, partial [Thermotogota bacterium]|nr:site-specific integrase [Thermotogota bacterium]